ncbi:phage holin family protein [Paenibacillus oenotherae]|uniref:Phage holin family protein n=1 Tax=Paenibacillus oenotherae TaxID=1435645 RepID=A0ABS7D853_9BACL|nr:phage holin family protein [Paenibacillus oenotherae]MBW7475963.1 phage holin family protein [Paenibacillus oenotherae]
MTNQLREYGVNLATAAVGASGKEATIGGYIAAAGLFLSGLLGGWDMALKVLLVLMVVDYVTGVLGAAKHKKLNSDVMYWGGIRKMVVLVVVGLGAMIDDWIQPGAPIFRTAAIYFYAGREGLSVIENLGTIGVPLPRAIHEFLTQLNEKGGGSDGKNV